MDGPLQELMDIVSTTTEYYNNHQLYSYFKNLGIYKKKGRVLVKTDALNKIDSLRVSQLIKIIQDIEETDHRRKYYLKMMCIKLENTIL